MFDEDKLGVSGCVVLAILIPALVVLSMVLGGWVLSILWGWFIVPVFGVAPLSVVYAIGLTTVARTIIQVESQSDKKFEKLSDSIAFVVSRTILVPLFTLFIGWIIQMFI